MDGPNFLNVNMRIGEPVALTLMFICSQTECYKKSRWSVTRGESTGSGKIKKNSRIDFKYDIIFFGRRRKSFLEFPQQFLSNSIKIDSDLYFQSSKIRGILCSMSNCFNLSKKH